MTDEDAMKLGCTHHGKMFSVPCWLSTGAEPLVIPKSEVLGLWIDFCSYAVQFANMLGADWSFPMHIGAPIVASASTGDKA